MYGLPVAKSSSLSFEPRTVIDQDYERSGNEGRGCVTVHDTYTSIPCEAELHQKSEKRSKSQAERLGRLVQCSS